jgi:ATP-dependent exoDNAse (exonuclease V) alpha subunit
VSTNLSIRVPWHENGWAGNVPCNCESDDDKDIQPIPLCLKQSGAFMSSEELIMTDKHPYSVDWNGKKWTAQWLPFKNIEITTQKVLPFSLIGTPFYYMLVNDERSPHKKNMYDTGFDESKERGLGGNTWISHGENQRNAFEHFYKGIKNNESLVFPYTKFVPMTDTPGRVIVGVGKICSISEQTNYKYKSGYAPDSSKDVYPAFWERVIQHTIREDNQNGFLIPFQEIKKFLEKHPDQNPDELLPIVRSEFKYDFSYGTFQVSYDATIWALNRLKEILCKYLELNIAQHIDWKSCIAWLETEIDRVWKERGVFPGLGAVLAAFNVNHGYDTAEKLHSQYVDDELFDAVLSNLNTFGLNGSDKADLEDFLTEDPYKSYFHLISRLSLSYEQACFLVDKLKKEDVGFINSVIKNPYSLFEDSLESKTPIGIRIIDLAMFPKTEILAICPFAENTLMEDETDKRRIRAITISILEDISLSGSTLAPVETIMDLIMKFRTDFPIQSISKRIFSRNEDFFNEKFKKFTTKINGEDGSFLQLNRYVRIDEFIRNFIADRENIDLPSSENWDLSNLKNKEEIKEQLEILAHSKICVLTGGAGTGKTTALETFCSDSSVQTGGIIALAPTGKATTLLRKKIGKEFGATVQTIFGFLIGGRKGHVNYDPFIYRYVNKPIDSVTSNTTVIIDECSMLTEEMLAAIFDACRNAKRIILVGDPNQLPPIGAGTPFYDIVERFRNSKKNYAHLDIQHRQADTNGRRLDLELSKLFTDNQYKEVSETIFEDISNNNENIEFVKFNDAEQLHNKVLEVIVKVTGMSNKEDIDIFNESLGGYKNEDWQNYTNRGSEIFDAVESWQILSPYKNDLTFGANAINRFIHETYRISKSGNVIGKLCKQNPIGEEKIIVGDKIINLINQKKEKVWDNSSRREATINISNGDIGLVFRIDDKDKNKVQFISNPDNWVTYFGGKSLSGEDNSGIELAYALTIHKSQGSGFGTTILIINEPEGLKEGVASFSTTREMIYTALTRQKDKIYIIYNREPIEMRKYSAPCCSDILNRTTNLFGNPIEIVVNPQTFKFNDKGRIYLTENGERVRSKSEVIIANQLKENEINYTYEETLTIGNINLHPDFTLIINNKIYYWEHLGLLSIEKYKANWERKKQTYASAGITEGNTLIITTEEDILENRIMEKINIRMKTDA